MQVLDIQTLPLTNHCLIEASAGTGKTFTISHVYLRLLIEPHSTLANNESLKVDNILVVTFTKAATKELKARVYNNLYCALEYLQGGHSDDPIMTNIVDRAVKLRDKNSVLNSLQQAVLNIDEAAIYTIHGFCQKVLSQFSFYAGLSFQQSLMQSPDRILLTIAQQYWRQNFYRLDAMAANCVMQFFNTPEKMLEHLKPLLNTKIVEKSINIEQQLQCYNSLLEQITQCWQQEADNLKAIFAAKGFGNSYTTRTLPVSFAALDAICAEPARAFSLIDDNALLRFTQSEFDIKTANAKKSLQHPLFALLDELKDWKANFQERFLLHTALGLQQAIDKQKNEQGIFFFDDLIKQLAYALSDNNPSHQQLLDNIRQQLPVALIDEFQDTDHLQYQIFNSIYAQNNQLGLLMIGDPKQAIYSFRGADIDAYFSAKKSVDSSQQFSLDTNWRSAKALINNVNSLFTIQQNPFLDHGFDQFLPVKAAKEQSGLACELKNSSFSITSINQELGSVGELRDDAAQKTSVFIKQLLDKKTPLNNQSIEAKDIAVLVRSAAEGKLMQQALSAVQVNSILVTKDSLFETAECQQFLMMLNCVLEPFSIEKVSTFLALDVINFSQQELLDVQNDIQQFNHYQQYLIKARQCWFEQGFIAMWNQLLVDFNVVETLFTQHFGLRRVTNLQQIAELFHQCAYGLYLPLQQINNFENLMQENSGDNDEQKLRLDSEANLVQIMTIHASKGLEFGLVCCPFLFASAAGKNQIHKTIKPLLYGAKVSDEQLALKAFSEELRLLYVALTRAKYHLNIGFAPVKGVEKSALWHLLFGQQTKLKDIEGDLFWQVFDALPDCLIDPVLLTGESTQTLQKTELIPALSFDRDLQQSFVARSYSALLNHHAQIKHNEDELAPDDNADVIAAVVPEFKENIFHFPKGATAGNFMHQVLEDFSFQDDEQVLLEITEKQLHRYGFDELMWSSVMKDHFKQCLSKKLPVIDAALAEMTESKIIKEMGFYWHANKTDGGKISRILASFRDSEAPLLNNIEGFFSGFIDLTFEYQGRFYVLDYKSNFLGFSTTDYAQQHLHDAMIDHDYDLQYIIYLAALQRYLRNKISNYDYDAHIGGAYYLFLRGINSQDGAGIYFNRPEKKWVDAIEQLFYQGHFSEVAS